MMMLRCRAMILLSAAAIKSCYITPHYHVIVCRLRCFMSMLMLTAGVASMRRKRCGAQKCREPAAAEKRYASHTRCLLMTLMLRDIHAAHAHARVTPC